MIAPSFVQIVFDEAVVRAWTVTVVLRLDCCSRHGCEKKSYKFHHFSV
jgi:hypothetical protein